MNLKLKISLIIVAFSFSAFAAKPKIFSPQTTFPFTIGSNRLQHVPKNTIYLTFDDGPTARATPEILTILNRYRIKATFFVVGQMAKNNHKILARIRGEGHRLGNHSYAHEFKFPTEDHFLNSLKNTNNQIRNYVQQNDILLFRAPGGVWSEWRSNIGNNDYLLQQYVGPIYWNVGGGSVGNSSADWKCWSKKVSVGACRNDYLKQIYANYRKGQASIILMHDINNKSAKMLAELLRSLQRDRVRWNYDLIENIPAVQEMNYFY